MTSIRVQRRVPRIHWVDSNGPHSVTLRGKAVAGSSPGADLVVSDPSVSRMHVEFEPTDSGVVVRDVGSRNGTWLFGNSVQHARLSPGQSVRVGVTELNIDFDALETEEIELWPEDHFVDLVGGSEIMRRLYATLARVAQSDASVLIHGETGTGKELVARSLHDAGPRKLKPFVVVDCAALPEQLLDAELFGHVRGAFTGAVQTRAGAIEEADGGTVFLDEIGELPVSMQPKLLRVLEQKTVRRVGESNHRSVDVRFVCATHRDLLAMVNSGTFREDLYFRLAVVPVTLPALRDRPSDIAVLVEHFLRKASAPAFPPDLVRELSSRTWRGNVRELRNFVERVRALGHEGALALSPAEGRSHHARAHSAAPAMATLPPPADVRISSAHVADAGSSAHSSNSWGTPAAPVVGAFTLPPTAMPSVGLVALQGSPASSDDALYRLDYKTFRERWIEEGEKTYLQKLLDRHARNVVAAAKEAQVDRTYIYRLMRKYGIE